MPHSKTRSHKKAKNPSSTTETITKPERIWQVVAAIPAGCVCSYGEVAQRAGLPGYARYVGSTLSKLPEGSSLPWHRVLDSQGRIRFPVDSVAFAEQTSRLRAEGVEVNEGRVNMRRYGWKIE